MRAKEIVEAEAGDARRFFKKLGKVPPSDHLDWDEFDPDPVASDDLMRWIKYIGFGTRPFHAANRWFPGQPGRLKAVKLIRGYCWNKVTAMGLRLEGNIETARQYEAICDRIYSELPDYAKW